MNARFRDRADAGARLAEHFDRSDVDGALVLGLPRGGVPVAAALAEALGLDLDVFVAQKVGAPGQRELGIAAVAEGSDEVVPADVFERVRVGADQFLDLVAVARQEVQRRVTVYREGRLLPSLDGRDVIVVDDGLATGVTAHAALHSLRCRRPRRLILAVPVCAPTTRDRLARIADEVVCVAAPADLVAVGQWYEDFRQIPDERVVELLARASPRAPTGPALRGPDSHASPP